MKSKNKIYSIGEASRLTGVTIKQIRNWEEKGYIPAPMRVICGERAYRPGKHAQIDCTERDTRDQIGQEGNLLDDLGEQRAPSFDHGVSEQYADYCSNERRYAG